MPKDTQNKKSDRQETYRKIADNYGVPVDNVKNALAKPPGHEDFWKWLAPAINEIRELLSSGT